MSDTLNDSGPTVW